MPIRKNTSDFYPVFQRKLNKKIENRLSIVARSNWYSSFGPYNKLLEDKLSHKFNIKHCSLLSNGTAALIAALHALNLREGDKVMLPSFTIVSCLNAILFLNLKPVIVDVDIDTWCMNEKIIKSNFSSDIKAIIYVHIFGNTDQINKVASFCKKRNIYLIEDCAESMFTKYKNKYTGTFGDISTFSLYGNKLISSGEGGFTLTKKKIFDQRIKNFINLYFGKKDRFNHKNLGLNFRLSNIQASIAYEELKLVNFYRRTNNFISHCYKKYLNKEKIIFQYLQDEVDHILWMQPIIFKKKVNIAKLQKKLLNKGIDTRRLFKPLSKMAYLKKYKCIIKQDKNSSYIYNQGLYLPSGHDLNEKKIIYIANIVNKIT